MYARVKTTAQLFYYIWFYLQQIHSSHVYKNNFTGYNFKKWLCNVEEIKRVNVYKAISSYRPTSKVLIQNSVVDGLAWQRYRMLVVVILFVNSSIWMNTCQTKLHVYLLSFAMCQSYTRIVQLDFIRDCRWPVTCLHIMTVVKINDFWLSY